MKKIALSLLTVSLLAGFCAGLTGCDIGTSSRSEIKIGGKTMGTFYNITVIGDYPGGQEQLRREAEEVLDSINREISFFDRNSELSRFNQHRSTEPFKVSQDVADVVIASIRAGQELHGAVDVTVGPLVNLWGFGHVKPETLPPVPDDNAINAARKRIGLDKLHVTVSYNSAKLKKDIPQLEVDLSTVGEGFGADKLAELMDRRGIQNYMVSVAGAIRTKGLNSRGKDWVVAIEHPTTEQAVGQRLEIPVCTRGQAISTSGSYRNYKIDEKTGERLSHIIDPATGKPITHHTVSITVVGPTALWTDAIDTGLMVMGSDEALRFANERSMAIYTIVKEGNEFKSHYSKAMQQYLVCD